MPATFFQVGEREREGGIRLTPVYVGGGHMSVHCTNFSVRVKIFKIKNWE